MQDDENQTVAQMMQNGTYFREARAWYQTIYIDIVTERAFFLLIGGLAGLIALIAIIAFTDLMPITVRRPLLLASKDVEFYRPELIRLHPLKENLNRSLTNFFTLTYVVNRESFKFKSVASNEAFVLAHSGPEAQQAFLTDIASQHLDTTLGKTGIRTIIPTSIVIDGKKRPYTATVTFQRTEVINKQTTQTRWQAVIQFSYSPLLAKEVIDKQSGASIIATKDPQFQVLRYDRKQLP